MIVSVNLKRVVGILFTGFGVSSQGCPKSCFVVVPCSPELKENIYKSSFNLECIVGMLFTGFGGSS